MTPFLIAIVIVVLAVLGPILVFRPTPRQRQLERLRRAAMVAGLQPRVAERADDGTPETEYIYPWRPRVPSALKTARLVFARDENGHCQRLEAAGAQALDWLEAEAVAQLCSELHPCCRQIRIGRDGVSVLWAERGDEARVTAIAEALRGLATHLTEQLGGALSEAVRADQSRNGS